MKHLGDITKINGALVPLVDVVTGGSPCQDLSVAGQRKGLEGERSGLFMEQIRIIKEMRNESIRRMRDEGTDVDLRLVRPRFMVWENVAGAFSSNKGEDFRTVLEETARIADKDAVIPRLEGGAKWSPSGCILADGWSIAWRLHDAQFWGVPQRRKRIALVADFGGSSAPEILFERKGVSGHPEQSEQTRETTSREAGEMPEEPSSFTLKIRGGCEVDSHGNKAGKGPLVQTELSGTLGVSQDQTLIHKANGVTFSNIAATRQADDGPKGFHSQAMREPEQNVVLEPVVASKASFFIKSHSDGKAETLVATDYKETQLICYGISPYGSNSMLSDNPHSGIYEAETSRTIDVNGGNPNCNQGGMIVLEGNGQRESHRGDGYKESDTMYTLNTVEQHGVCYGLDRASFNQGQNAKYDFSVDEELSPPIVARGPGGVMSSVRSRQETTKE